MLIGTASGTCSPPVRCAETRKGRGYRGCQTRRHTSIFFLAMPRELKYALASTVAYVVRAISPLIVSADEAEQANRHILVPLHSDPRTTISQISILLRLVLVSRAV